jgi:hypothetical protein
MVQPKFSYVTAFEAILKNPKFNKREKEHSWQNTLNSSNQNNEGEMRCRRDVA